MNPPTIDIEQVNQYKIVNISSLSKDPKFHTVALFNSLFLQIKPDMIYPMIQASTYTTF